MVVSDLLAPRETLVHLDPLENWALLANPGKQVTMEHQCQDRKGQKDPLGHLDHLDLLELLHLLVYLVPVVLLVLQDFLDNPDNLANLAVLDCAGSLDLMPNTVRARHVLANRCSRNFRLLLPRLAMPV